MSKKTRGGKRSHPHLRLVAKAQPSVPAASPETTAEIQTEVVSSPGTGEPATAAVEIDRIDELLKKVSRLENAGRYSACIDLAREESARARRDHHNQLLQCSLGVLVLSIENARRAEGWKSQDQLVNEQYEAVRELASIHEDLHRNKLIFEIYIHSLGSQIETARTKYDALVTACSKQPCLIYLEQLWYAVVQIEGEIDESPHLELPPSLHNISKYDLYDQLLRACKATIETLDGGLEEAHAKVIEHDTRLRALEPWQYMIAKQGFDSLDSPKEESVGDYTQDSPTQPVSFLTPRAWEFLWQLEHVGPDGLAAFASLHQHPYGDDVVEGLRLILQALYAASEQTDSLFAQGVRQLMFGAWHEQYLFGYRLAVDCSGSRFFIEFGTRMRVSSIQGLLTKMLECAPASFARAAELLILAENWHVLGAYFDPEPSSGRLSMQTPGMQWLIEISTTFACLAGNVLTEPAERFHLFLKSLCKSAETGVDSLDTHHWLNETKTEIALSAQQSANAIRQLQRMADLRASMPTRSIAKLRGAIWKILATVFAAKDIDQTALLAAARGLEEDMYAAGAQAWLGFLEINAGDKRSALEHYLRDIELRDVVSDNTQAAIKRVWAQTLPLDQHESIVQKLRDHATRSRHADAVNSLADDAQEALAKARSRDKYERTALLRWPALNYQARRVLCVLDAISGFDGFEELGRYAGMEAYWAKKHYETLITNGMLLLDGTTFRINPHIRPLIEREGQHIVIGRIVRSHGTSAVKQVFNSQREFSIYQVLVQLCPNHLVFPNCALQSIMSYERLKELVAEDEFGYYLRASVDIVVVSSTTYLPMLAIEVDSVWHDTEHQKLRDVKKDRLFAAAGIPFLRLQPAGNPSPETIRVQVAQHVDELVRGLREDLPGYEQAKGLLLDLSQSKT